MMLLAAGVAALLVRRCGRAVSELEEEFSSLKAIVPFVLGWIVSMGTTTASSVSMEANRSGSSRACPFPRRTGLFPKVW
ncbi:MAG: hypothetical protein R2912_08820 [Eubacteriales bacterium]